MVTLNENLEKYFRGKRVFLTGHTGFKGAWLLSWLKKLGADVAGYALPAQPESLYRLINGNTLCRSTEADIRNAALLKEVALDFNPDFVFHLAAQALVRPSYQLPVETFEVNVMGTMNVLDALRSLQKPCTAVIITTDKVYENSGLKKPFREEEPLGGYDPYSASKAAAEIATSSFQRSYFAIDTLGQHKKAVASARAGNVIGGGDFAVDRLVPDIIAAFRKNQPARIRNPESVRPWQHVLDPLHGYLMLAARLSEEPEKFTGAWNFGPAPDDVLTVRELAEKIKSGWGLGSLEFPPQDGAPHEAGYLTLDNSKAVKLLGWKPKFTASESIQWTAEWYQQVFLKKEEPAGWVASQLQKFAGE